MPGSKFSRKTTLNFDSSKKKTISKINLLDSSENNLVSVTENYSTKSKYLHISHKPNDSSDLSKSNKISAYTTNGGGEENIEERPSDLYSNLNHASNRIPHAMNVYTNQGVSKQRFSDFNQECFNDTEPDVFHSNNITTINTVNFSPKWKNSTISINQSGGDFRNYNTNCTNKNKENLDPQAFHNHSSSFESSFIFGPKAR